jgi:hypothetical protein
MQLDESYEILEITPQDGVVVWKARDRKTGKMIQVHLFPNEKIPEASQICARLLSLPGEARSKVLKYGPDGSSTYFITELLPQGEGLGAWVLREATPRAPERRPEVSGGVVGNLRRMEIEPAPLQPARGPESRRGPMDQAPSPNAAPHGAQSEPKVRPIPPAANAPAPQLVGPGAFTILYTKEDFESALHSSPAPQPPLSRSVPETPPDPIRFSQIYGAQDLKVPEAPISSEPAPQASTSNQAGPGLDTFIGIHPTLPRAASPAGTPQMAPSPFLPPMETGPVFEAPAAPPQESASPPPRVTWPTRQPFTFDVPVPQPPDREQSEAFSLPPSPPAPPLPAPARRLTTPEARRAPEPLLSGRVVTLTALGVLAVAAVVVLIVDFLR